MEIQLHQNTDVVFDSEKAAQCDGWGGECEAHVGYRVTDDEGAMLNLCRECVLAALEDVLP